MEFGAATLCFSVLLDSPQCQSGELNGQCFTGAEEWRFRKQEYERAEIRKQCFMSTETVRLIRDGGSWEVG